jgi:hypothetical protein
MILRLAWSTAPLGEADFAGEPLVVNVLTSQRTDLNVSGSKPVPEGSIADERSPPVAHDRMPGRGRRRHNDLSKCMRRWLMRARRWSSAQAPILPRESPVPVNLAPRNTSKLYFC